MNKRDSDDPKKFRETAMSVVDMRNTVPIPSNSDRYALRLYDENGLGTSNLLCDYRPEIKCPQWNCTPDRRYTWSTAEEALDFLTYEVLVNWKEQFADRNIRVVRIIPPVDESYKEVTLFCIIG